MISLAVVAVLGSLFTAFAVNMFFGDVVNVSAGGMTWSLFVSLPTICVAFSLVLATIYLLRIYRYKNSFKTLCKRFLIIIIALNALGFIGVILSAVITYGTLLSVHPFPGYQIMFLIINLLLMGGAIFGLIKIKEAKDDEEPVKIKVSYAFKTVGWIFFLLLAYDRFGTLLVAPSFVYVRTLYMSFPFYLFLAVPLFLGVVEALYVLEVLDNKKIRLLAIIGGLVAVCLFAYIAIMGMNNSAFIASVSQCMPLERIISKPVEILIHVVVIVVVTLVIIIQVRKAKEQE